MLLIVLAAFLVINYAFTDQEYQQAFWKWRAQNGKKYNSFAEHNRRFAIFRENLNFIHSHDPIAKGYTVALNEFADLTGEEFRSFACGMNVSVTPSKFRIRRPGRFGVEKLPSSWDWRDKGTLHLMCTYLVSGAVTKVKNQGQCGSCWSFSATGSIEGAYYIAAKQLVSLSEQNLVDCSTEQGNQGCNGGLMDQAFRYVIENRGIDTEKSYPYTATGPNECKYKKSNMGANISSYTDIDSGDEEGLLKAVYKTPTSVAIDASHQAFQFYSSGVYYEANCSSVNLDHGVLAVGYGTENGKDYWLVRE